MEKQCSKRKENHSSFTVVSAGVVTQHCGGGRGGGEGRGRRPWPLVAGNSRAFPGGRRGEGGGLMTVQCGETLEARHGGIRLGNKFGNPL